MRISLDGGETFQQAPEGAIVVYDDLDIPGADAPGFVEFHFTGEGLITDVWVDAENVGSEGETVEELVDRLCEDNS